MMERYREYKESGVKWLGEIPSHWEVVPLRKYLKINTRRNKPEAQLLSVTREEGVIVRNVESKEENHNYIPDDLSNYKYVQRGQFVINKMKSWQGSYGVSNYDGIVSPAYFVYDLNYPNKDYFNIAIRSRMFSPFFSKYSKGIRVDQWDLTPEALKIIPFLEPPKAEQDAIVRYLDTATSEIDKAIAMQQKMIDLLNERKQIIIQNAVTKGLDENVEMKESGVEWIGRIPKHWEVEPFSRHFTFGKGLPITKANLQEDGIAVISYGQIHAKNNLGTTLTESLVRYVSPTYIETHPQCLLKGNDFIFADTSEDIEGSGNFAFNDFDNKIFAGYHTVVARPNDLLFPKYYAYLFKSKAWKSQIQSLVNGVKVYSIGRRILKTSMLLIPSEDEQKNIVRFLDKQTSAIEKTIETISRQITLLQERKQIIINEVVTGKVRVS